MSKITIIEGNSDDKDQVRNFMVKGEPGNDGVSPTVETSKTGDTATIVITDGEGEHEFELKDGVSPTVSTSKTGKVTTVTITDADGPHTATINDGEDGATTNIIDSATLTDNTTQTYSGRIVDSKIEALTPITLSFNFTTGSTDSSLEFEQLINYPTGLTKDNLLFLTHRVKNNEANGTRYVSTANSSTNNAMVVDLRATYIYVRGWCGKFSTQHTIDLIFLKIS